MKINLRQIPDGGAPFTVHTEVDLSRLQRFGEFPIPGPVSVDAEFVSRGGTIALRYTAGFTIEGPCGRCLEPVAQPARREISHILAERAEDERQDSIIPVPDGILELDELVQADICLELDGVLLCGEDCKGLCPQCGADRNKTECDCGAQTTDSRFDALRALLADENS